MSNEELTAEVLNLKKIINAQNRILTKIAKSMYLIPMSDKEAEKLELEKRKNAEQALNAHHLVEDRTESKDDSDKFTGLFSDFPSDVDVFEDVIADDLR